jgi:diguanylate cyclase (GGDEF)-like protein
MRVFLRIDINIAAIILLGAVFLIALKSLDRKDELNKKFLRTSLIILVEIFFETMTCIINGNPGEWLIPVSVILHICLFVTAPVLAYSWYLFIHSWVIPDGSISKKQHLFMLIPIAVNFMLAVLSPVFGWVFYIGAANVYHRGSLFVLSSAITYFYLLFSLGLVFRQRKKVMKQEYIPLFVFGFLPIAGGILQTLFYGVLLMWSSTSFSLVIVYNFLQQRMIHLDALTGVWTRGSFYYFISHRIKYKTDEKFGIISVDLDGLKQINDRYGHFEGDCAIKATVHLIRTSLKKTDILARLGGDEFAIFIEGGSQDVLEKTIRHICLCLDDYNKGASKNYKLGCSFGADIFSADYKTVEQFLHHVDNLLYDNKKEKKACGGSPA